MNTKTAAAHSRFPAADVTLGGRALYRARVTADAPADFFSAGSSVTLGTYPPGHPQPPEPGPGQPPQPTPRVASTRAIRTRGVPNPKPPTGEPPPPPTPRGWVLLAVGCVLMAVPVGAFLGWALAVAR